MGIFNNSTTFPKAPAAGGVSGSLYDQGPLLLDVKQNAVLALSLWKLRTNYDGPCAKVRRFSDGTAQDFGFVDNYLDTAAVDSFLGVSGDGFMLDHYDQSGYGNDAGQATALMQPRLVVGGAYRLDSNGKKTINYTLINTHMRVQPNPSLKADKFTVSLVGNKDVAGGENWETFFQKAPASWDDGFGITALDEAEVNFGVWLQNYTNKVLSFAQGSVNNMSIIQMTYDQVNLSGNLNGTDLGTDNYAGTVEQGDETILIGAFNQSGDGSLQGNISEVIMWPEDLSTEDIEYVRTDKSNRYGIAI